YYRSRYLKLAKIIKQQFPDAKVSGPVGTKDSFEIKINGQLIFSKLESGGFPHSEDILQQVRNEYNGAEVEKVTQVQSCTIQ
uniref:Selenoprotein W n=1 Tax=Latimeria chalumnae TaxID=7897 RepID=M3XKZ9_LATCH